LPNGIFDREIPLEGYTIDIRWLWMEKISILCKLSNVTNELRTLLLRQVLTSLRYKF
jgi:hypothetical protein